jgi:hypothetical protein
MGKPWSSMVKDHSFGTYGSGLAKATYEGIKEPNRFVLVKDALKKYPEIDGILDDNGLEWPSDENKVTEFFEDLSEA